MSVKLFSYPRVVLLLLAAVLSPRPAHAAVTVVHYWHMGENDPQASSGRPCTNTIDSVGGDTLTNLPVGNLYPLYTNGVSPAASQDAGSTLALSLTNGQYGTAALGTSASDNFGMECWVNPGTTSTSAGGQVLAYNGLRGNGWGLYQMGTNYMGLFGGEIFFGNGLAQAGTWVHLALVRNSGTTTLYTNGVPAATTTSTPIAPTSSFTVGGDAVYGEFFTGLIDEVRVFTFTAGQFSTNDLLFFNRYAVFTLSATNFSVPATAGSNSVSLTAVPVTGTWTAGANVPWLHLSATSGTGNTNLTFTYDANPGLGDPSVPRVGTLTIAGQTVTVSQAQPSYSFAGNYSGNLGAPFIEVPWTAGSSNASLTVTPNAGQWSFTVNAGWIHPQIGATGAGSTNITFTFDPNTGAGANVRYGVITLFNPSGFFLENFWIFQQAPTNGLGQVTYHFTGNLQAYLPQYVPANASAALKSVANGDVFFLTMTLVPSPIYSYYGEWACGVNYITFSVPSRGLVYSAAFEDLEVLDDDVNPDTLRWDDDNVDSTVAMIFWARDFTDTALLSSSVPNPLNLTGFHSGESFAQIILFDNENGNPELFYGNLLPMPPLNIQHRPGTNTVSWATSDATYTSTLQSSALLGPNAVWQNVTNVPATVGLTNILNLPATNKPAQFFRLQIL